MIAFISDLHSNTEALGVCLAEIERLDVDRVICLGDVIGYGPEPREVLLKVMEVCEFSLLGNHEHGAMFYASDFNPRARAAIEWTRDQLNRKDCSRDENMRMWSFLGQMKELHEEGNFMLAHGSPKDPIRDYVVPKDCTDGAKMQERFDLFGGKQVCFVGHSHVPGVYPEGCLFLDPNDVGGEYRIGEARTLVNIGSVGQPRDGDRRLSFVTYDGEVVRFHRLEYDYESTMTKIRAVAELPDNLADRLAQGR